MAIQAKSNWGVIEYTNDGQVFGPDVERVEVTWPDFTRTEHFVTWDEIHSTVEDHGHTNVVNGQKPFIQVEIHGSLQRLDLWLSGLDVKVLRRRGTDGRAINTRHEAG